jgi:hypothetical protein
MLLQYDSLELLFSYEITSLNRHHSYIVKTVIYLRILTLLENDGDVYFNFARDVICIVVTGCGNTIGNSITINKQRLERVSIEYPENLATFIEFKTKGS